MSPTSAPQMQFNQKETASHKLLQYPEQSDKQWDSEHKYKRTWRTGEIFSHDKLQHKSKKIQGKCCLSRTGCEELIEIIPV